MQKNRIDVHVDKNAFVDDGNGIIRFPAGQVISDDQPQRNGTRYDIETMDISEWNGTITEDHNDMLRSVIGKAVGFAKRGNQIVLEGIRFATKTAAGRLAYDLIREGFVEDLSIETYGPWPDEEGVYYKSKLVGLSAVVFGNNRSARINEVALNSLARAKKDGLDTTELEQLFQDESKPKVPNAAPKQDVAPSEPPAEEKPQDKQPKQENHSMTKKVEDEKPKNTASQTPPNEEEKPKAPETPAPANQGFDMNALKDMLGQTLDERIKPLEDKMSEVEKNALDASAKEPGFKKADNQAPKQRNGMGETDIKNMDWRERTGLQLQTAYSMLKHQNMDAAATLRSINSFHFEKLVESGKANNAAVSLDTLGNFVVAPEMVTEIEGYVSNYRPLLERFNFADTLSLVTSWIERTGEIDMDDVDMTDHGDNLDLKPIKKPSYTTHSATLKEFAAVTPVDASAIRFSAADIVEDITRMYRTAYDRALARSVIGRLEKALESNGNSVSYNYSSGAGGDVAALITLISAWAEVGERAPNGLYIFTEASYLHLLARTLKAGVSGPLSTVFTTGDIPRFLGKPYIVVPSDLLPSLGTAETKSWTFEGVSVTVNHGVIYTDPSNFKGRVSGGLNFSLSTEAAYEESGTVKAAYQRDKVVIRGYGYRKSAVTNTQDVAGILSPGIS